MARCAGVILAGGKSSRMGKDKAELSIHGRTLLQHMENILIGVSDVEAIYISRKDIMPDIFPNIGPLGGIYTALSKIINDNMHEYRHVLFVPVDMPALTPFMLSKLTEAPDDADLVHFDTYRMPFRISIDVKWLDILEEQIETGKDLSVERFQKSIPVSFTIEVLPSETHYLENINTPEEWHYFNNGGHEGM